MWQTPDPHQIAPVQAFMRRAALAIDLVGPDEEPPPPPPPWWRRATRWLARRLRPSRRPAGSASRDQP